MGYNLKRLAGYVLGFILFYAPCALFQRALGYLLTDIHQLATEDVLRKERGVLPLSVEISVSRAATQRYNVGKGRIVFLENDKLYATIVVEVVNSLYKE